ncbi:MAG: S41 family peptidase [Nitrospiraceae bacterium]|jgi:carboxyl-terminal processing protease|nr:S41 family peptidase [Nitrospiraceae bacterium]
MFSRKKLILIPAVLLILFGGIVMGRWGIQAVSAQSSYEDLRLFTEVMSMIKKNYVDDVKTKDLVTGAIKGMLSSLDPHSGYMTAEQFKEFQADTKGEFGGLGIQIAIKDSVVTVIAPIEDTPAYRAGLKAGDKIMKIAGESTKDMSIHDAVTRMRGPKGKPVTLSIFRDGWKETKDFTIVRDIIKIKSVKSKMIRDDVGYVKLTQFQETTASDLSKALAALHKSGMKSLVLDLRNNPGGLLNAAVEVTEQFLPAKKLVVFIKGRTGEKMEYFTEDEFKTYEQIPIVVLVNQGSASASEIVAGALKDWNRAVVLGVQTFGKGSVQSLVPLTDGSGLRLTTAKYYTPKGTSIQSVGITPDIVVKLEAKEGKESKEVTVVRERDLDRHLKNEKNEPSRNEKGEEKAVYEVDEKDDTQLLRAIDILKTWKVIEHLPKPAA